MDEYMLESELRKYYYLLMAQFYQIAAMTGKFDGSIKDRADTVMALVDELSAGDTRLQRMCNP